MALFLDYQYSALRFVLFDRDDDTNNLVSRILVNDWITNLENVWLANNHGYDSSMSGGRQIAEFNKLRHPAKQLILPEIPMCAILYREGREWALESIRNLHNVVGKPDGYRQLINYLERGLKGKPAAFARGVQSVIDEVKAVAA